MNNITSILSLLLVVAFGHHATAQSPDWRVNSSEFQYTMTVTAFLNLEGRTLSSEQDMVGAFVGDEVRGGANLIYVEGVDRYLAYLTIYANQESDIIEFKIYDSSNNKITPVSNRLGFRIDGQVGNVFQAFCLSQPALNSEANIIKFYFSNIDTVRSDFSEGRLDIEVEYGEDITTTIPEFMLSDGARIYIDETLQVSGDTTLDFTFPIVYSVLSEDESQLNTYDVKVTTASVEGDPGFFSTNVITANNDGDNDYWYVRDVSNYRDYTFKIFDVNGRILYESMGYQNDWDGHYKGNKLDRGKYYFEVESKERNSVVTGNILVVY